MLYVDGIAGLVTLSLWIYCVIDVISADHCRNLPKTTWLLLVIMVPLVGSVAWLVAGRPVNETQWRPAPRTPGFPEYERSNRAYAVDADEDAEFLRKCRERAEEQREKHRRQHGINRLESE